MGDLWQLATASLVLWWLTGTVLWAFIGAMICSGSRLPVWIGALAGGVGWFVGVLVVSVVGLVRRTERRRRARETGAPSVAAWDAAVAGPSDTGVFGGGSGGFGAPGGLGAGGFGAGSSDARAATAGGSEFTFGSAFSATPETPFSQTAFSQTPFSQTPFSETPFSETPMAPVDSSHPTTGVTATAPGSVPGWVRPAVLVTGVLAGAALGASALVDWVGTSVSAPSDLAAADTITAAGATAWSPADLGVVAILLISSAAAVAALAVFAARRLRGRYLILMMLIAAPWFTVAFQLIIAVTSADGVGELVRLISQGRFGADVWGAAGVWLAFAATALVVVLSVVAGSALVMSRRRSVAVR